ncbi:MAG: NAD-dependent epimerase [Tannerellaceae bacterium]|nr:NAD-dependent epimerase [Tannerellaceae bacterium]MCD8264244.1 NAD-dependent epimerase [Tannerellaceae bacterium]
MKILVTGTAGFIGYYVVKALLSRGDEVVGIDNINDYYDVTLKEDRLLDTGVRAGAYGEEVQSTLYAAYRFIRLDLTDREAIDALFAREQFDSVCHLAAQAGVRYLVENPYAYVQSNVVGFLNIMENCRNHPVKHLVYASSSSVYGLNEEIPYKETDKTDRPASLYAATKKANEVMAHAYSKLYNLPTTGLRFFTVYGPWGRPDMAPFLFMNAITQGKPIKVFNHGNMLRDFTYVGDIVEGVVRVIDAPSTEAIPYRIYNIGNSAPVKLESFISVIENVTGKQAVKQYMEMQPGDVPCTYADTSRLEKDLNYKPSTTIEEGIAAFYTWYKKRYL